VDKVYLVALILEGWIGEDLQDEIFGSCEDI